ncbi:hypothetical protein K402DRAFT_417378 [Aulographum hederae CBS 113979]|uniref:Uncharacterized protein n=1 Tax=Aulographum hederae CBS 113979 TaxID=1176131 RepID=A0A6G1HC03_9PEZI|nr:hypothetical protein K402DRAFT_417378 [Aulographum hederae CBS 113979]
MYVSLTTAAMAVTSVLLFFTTTALPVAERAASATTAIATLLAQFRQISDEIAFVLERVPSVMSHTMGQQVYVRTIRNGTDAMDNFANDFVWDDSVPIPQYTCEDCQLDIPGNYSALDDVSQLGKVVMGMNDNLDNVYDRIVDLFETQLDGAKHSKGVWLKNNELVRRYKAAYEEMQKWIIWFQTDEPEDPSMSMTSKMYLIALPTPTTTESPRYTVQTLYSPEKLTEVFLSGLSSETTTVFATKTGTTTLPVEMVELEPETVTATVTKGTKSTKAADVVHEDRPALAARDKSKPRDSPSEHVVGTLDPNFDPNFDPEKDQAYGTYLHEAGKLNATKSLEENLEDLNIPITEDLRKFMEQIQPVEVFNLPKPSPTGHRGLLWKPRPSFKPLHPEAPDLPDVWTIKQDAAYRQYYLDVKNTGKIPDYSYENYLLDMNPKPTSSEPIKWSMTNTLAMPTNPYVDDGMPTGWYGIPP